MGVEETVSEHVPKQTFLNEAQTLLEDALSTNASLHRALEEEDWCGLRLSHLSTRHSRLLVFMAS